MTEQHRPGRALRTAAVALVTASLAMGLAGCGWRLENPLPDQSSPDPVVEARDAAAEREQDVLDALANADDGIPSREALAAIEADAAPAHLEALGGVYRPQAGGEAESDGEGGPDDQAALYEGSLVQAVRAARDGALADAFATADQDLAAILASAGLTHSVALWYSGFQSAQAAAVDLAVAEARALPTLGPLEGAPLAPEAAEVSPATLADLALEHDRARYLYEVIAARSLGLERDEAWVRMDLHRERAEALVALPGVEDRREPLYALDAADVTGAEARAASARAMEQSLGWTYASLLVGATVQDRAWLLNAAFDAYTASAALPGFTPQELPVLPGLEVQEPASEVE